MWSGLTVARGRVYEQSLPNPVKSWSHALQRYMSGLYNMQLRKSALAAAPLAGDERLAQTPGRAFQEAAILPSRDVTLRFRSVKSGMGTRRPTKRAEEISQGGLATIHGAVSSEPLRDDPQATACCHAPNVLFG